MLRLQNGVYLQLHAYMFRVAIPYGTLSSKQLRRSRMSRAATTAATAISPRGRTSSSTGSSSPNCRMRWPISPRSASTPCRPQATTCATSPRTSGPAWRPARSRIPASGRSCCGSTPRCIRNSRSCRASSRFAITASEHDRAAIKIHDIGLRLYKNAEGETGFEVLVGGGLGRTPFIAKTIKPFVHGRDILELCRGDPARLQPVRPPRQHLQGAHQDPGARARHREVRQEVEEEWQQMRDSALTLDDAVIEEIRSRFSYPAYEKLPHMPDELKKAAHDPHVRGAGARTRCSRTRCRAIRS